MTQELKENLKSDNYGRISYINLPEDVKMFHEFFGLVAERKEEKMTANAFYVALEDNATEVEQFLFHRGYADVFFCYNKVFFKNTNPLNSHFKFHLQEFFRQKYPNDLYMEVDLPFSIDDSAYFKPDICGFYDFDVDAFDTFVDEHCRNPDPCFTIEVVNFKDTEFIQNILNVYYEFSSNTLITKVIFIDPHIRSAYLFVKGTNLGLDNETSPITKKFYGFNMVGEDIVFNNFFLRRIHTTKAFEKCDEVDFKSIFLELGLLENNSDF